MIEPHEFYFLHVNVTDSDVAQYTERVTAKGRDAEGNLIPHGILQICILQSLPFQTPHNHQVRDIRPGVPRLKQLGDAKHRPMLVESIADALLEFEHFYCRLGDKLRDIHADAEAVIDTLDKMIKTFEILRAKGKLPPSLKHLRSRDVKAAHETLATVHKSLTRRDYLRAAWLRGLPLQRVGTYRICRLQQAFLQYGPLKYSAEAIYYSIAAILRHVGEEKGSDLSKVAGRLRKRLQRSLP
jgi:hypothetical protein